MKHLAMILAAITMMIFSSCEGITDSLKEEVKDEQKSSNDPEGCFDDKGIEISCDNNRDSYDDPNYNSDPNYNPPPYDPNYDPKYNDPCAPNEYMDHNGNWIKEYPCDPNHNPPPFDPYYDPCAPTGYHDEYGNWIEAFPCDPNHNPPPYDPNYDPNFDPCAPYTFTDHTGVMITEYPCDPNNNPPPYDPYYDPNNDPCAPYDFRASDGTMITEYPCDDKQPEDCGLVEYNDGNGISYFVNHCDESTMPHLNLDPNEPCVLRDFKDQFGEVVTVNPCDPATYPNDDGEQFKQIPGTDICVAPDGREFKIGEEYRDPYDECKVMKMESNCFAIKTWGCDAAGYPI